MATMNISLTDDLKTFVEAQVAARSYTSASEYVRELVRRQRDVEELRAKLLEGAASPAEGEMDDAYFAELRRAAARRRG